MNEHNTAALILGYILVGAWLVSVIGLVVQLLSGRLTARRVMAEAWRQIRNSIPGDRAEGTAYLRRAHRRDAERFVDFLRNRPEVARQVADVLGVYRGSLQVQDPETGEWILVYNETVEPMISEDVEEGDRLVWDPDLAAFVKKEGRNE